MRRSRKRIVLGFTAMIGLSLCLAYFFAATLILWALVAFTILDVAIWFSLAMAQFVSRARYSGRRTLEDILAEKNPMRMVRLLRYHLGWSASRIAVEMNQREIFNCGLPWHEDDVSRIVKGINRFYS